MRRRRTRHRGSAEGTCGSLPLGLFLPAAKRFYEKKAAQRHSMLAMKALSHKIARACYYIMRDRVPFD
jgi:hypothetical protein